MKISNKTVLITGGAGGIGFELAKLLAAQGNTVLVCGRRQQALDEAAAAIKGLKTYVCDVGDAGQCADLIAAIKADGFTVNILVNNAAIMDFEDFSSPDLDMAGVRNTVNINVLGPMELIHRLMPDFLAQTGATIVNVCSPAGRCPIHQIPVYSASKAALDYFTRALRLQLRGKVKVLEVFPPTVNTPMTANISTGTGMVMSPADCAASLLQQWQQGRQDIWIGLESKAFRVLEFLVHPVLFPIINSPFLVKRK